MTHAEAQELLLSLAWGELDPMRAAEVETHISTCPECQQEHARLLSSRRMVAPLGELEEPSADFDDRIMAAARAEASLRADGTPGMVIEATGSVEPAAVEPAIIEIDARAPVRPAPQAARPRRAVRWAVGGAAAAAAVLALAVSSSLNRHEQPGVEGDAAKAYQIHIKAPQQEAARLPVPAQIPSQAPSPPPPASALAAEAGPGLEKVSRSPGTASPGTAARTPGEAGGGDISDRVAGASTGQPAIAAKKREDPIAAGARETAAKAPAEAPAKAPAAAASPPAVVEGPRAKLRLAEPGDAPAEAPAAVKERARAIAAASPGSPSPAPADSSAASAGPVDGVAGKTADAASGRAAETTAKASEVAPDALEEAARRARREGNYAAAAAQYRKAAQLRRGAADASAPAWDLAHATECLAAISQWTEARAVRRELVQLYPGERSAAGAAVRALRPAELSPGDSESMGVEPKAK